MGMREHIPVALRRLARAGLVPLILVLAGCDMVVLNPTGDVALQQRNLILIATALMLVIIIPVMVLTVLFAWRYRAGNAKATYDPHFDHSMPLELVIWSCPLLIIICLGAVTWSSTHLLDPFRPLDRVSAGKPIPPGTEPLDIQVVAMDWKWLFIYPGQGIATVNELTLPVDVPVRFTITSSTQMNAFYAPTLAGMIYAMPGMQSVLHAVLNKPGDSWGYSGNYSGAGFTDMRFQLHGVDKAGFDRWIAQVKAGEALEPEKYLVLDRPTEKVPVMHFGSVAPGLFNQVLNRCVEPGMPCESDVMAKDQQRGRGNPHGHMGTDMPPSNAGGPAHGAAPTPALFKEPADKGSSPNVTAPPRASTPGQPPPHS